MKTCTKCGVRKPLDQFPPVRRGAPRLQSWCRACFAAANATNYRKDAERVKTRVRSYLAARRAEFRAKLVAYLREHPCVDCGEADILVLEFDHIREKTADVSTLLTGAHSWSRILSEIEKCDVRCANCHRIRTSRDWPAVTEGIVRRQGRPRTVATPSGTSRVCRECGELKPATDYAFRSLEQQTRQWICLQCQRQYTRAWYARNRHRHLATVRTNNARYRAVARSQVRAVRASAACVDCGEANPIVLDFDHLRDKKRDVSALAHTVATDVAIEAEIAKCVVRCVNCHRRRTAKELGWYRALVS